VARHQRMHGAEQVRSRHSDHNRSVVATPLTAAFARDRLVALLGRTEGWRHSAGMLLEVGGAVLVLLLGVSTLLASMQV